MVRENESTTKLDFVFWFSWKLLCFKWWSLKATFECNKKNIYIYIYNFWDLDNRILVGVNFKFLKLKCMLHVSLKHFYLKKLIKTNKLLSLSTKIYMHIVCFVKTLIVTLFKETDKNK